MGKKLSGLYVAEIKSHYKDRVYTTFLLRRSYRDQGKVKQQTIANLSALPPDAVAILRDVLRGKTYVPQDEGLQCVATRAHGHVAAIGAMVDRLGLDKVLDPEPSTQRDLVVALITARIARPLTKLATTRWWQTTTLVDAPAVRDACPDDIYKALDWLVPRQERIERALARRHLQDGAMVLYDLSSSFVQGTHCPLAAFGYSRDRKRGKRQVNYGVLTDTHGRPVAIEVFAGNMADPATVGHQVDKLRNRFRLGRVVLVGDRGMLTSARIEEFHKIQGIDWISALRAKEIQALAQARCITPSLFDERDLAEIVSPEFPGERLVVCRNPFLADERARHRQELLKATEHDLAALDKRVRNRRLVKPEKIAEALGRIKNRYKVAKHFECVIGHGTFSYQRREDTIQREAELDGIYVVRTSVPAATLPTNDVVLGYKQLSKVERVFRTMKSDDLRVRPIHHWTADRVRAHFLLCMLVYYVEWQLRQAWAPSLSPTSTPAATPADRRWLPPNGLRRQPPRHPRSAPRTGGRFTASPRCWPTWAPSHPTPCASPIAPRLPTSPW